MKQLIGYATVSLAGAAALVGIAAAGPSPAQKCEAAKLKEVAKYEACRFKAEATVVTKGGSPDFTKCDSKFAEGWAKAETKAGGQCPTTGDQSSIGGDAAAHVSAVAAALSNSCGNGIIDGTEQCDGADVGGVTCQSLGFDAGTVLCSATCTIQTNGCFNTCDPLAPNCPAGQGCYLADATTAVCAPAGSLGAGASCMYVNDCSPGYFCGVLQSGNQCIQVCSVSDANTCPAGTTCQSVGWTPDPNVGGCL